MARAAQLIRDQRGSALIEFALVSPMVVMLILAALEFGMALRANAGLRELAGEAGRDALISYQIVGDEDGFMGSEELADDIRDKAATAKYNLNNGTLGVDVEVTDNTSLLTVQEVHVTLTYDYPISLPFIRGQTINLAVDRTFFVPHPATNDH